MMTCEKTLPLVSIVIVNWNGKRYLKECLSSISECDYPQQQIEIIICDNGSVDGSVEMLREHYPHINLIAIKHNLGFCKANNMGIRRSNGDVIFLLNNDTKIEKTSLRELVSMLKSPDMGIAGCKLCFMDTHIIQSRGCLIHSSGHGMDIDAGQINSGCSTPFSDVDFVCGAALAVRRSVLNEIGLLDPFFFAYGEDKDLCYRARKAGYRVVIANNVIVYHAVSKSWEKVPLKKSYLIKRNRFYFVLKHYSGVKLLKALTYYDLIYWLSRLKEQNARSVKLHNKNRRKKADFLKIAFNQLGGLFLAIMWLYSRPLFVVFDVVTKCNN